MNRKRSSHAISKECWGGREGGRERGREGGRVGVKE